MGRNWGLAGREVVSSVSLDVIGFLGEFSLSPLEIALSLCKFLHPSGVGGVWGRVIERVRVQRVG
jgi:hypothetical protein